VKVKDIQKNEWNRWKKDSKKIILNSN
jgi:hypothetical protein